MTNTTDKEQQAMNEQEILAGLGEIVEEIAGVPADEVTPSKSFVDDLDIDSLSMVEIAVAAQDKFGVEIPDEQLKDLTTVQDVVNFVAKNSGGSA
jgi:acyl carrier protein